VCLQVGTQQQLVEDPEAAMEDMLMALKVQWAGLITDISFGLDYLADKPKSPDNGVLAEVTSLLERITDFIRHLEFGAGHAPSELLVEIHPILDEFTLKALHLLRLDEAAQNGAHMSLCLGK
jgi:hypothetical protein